LKLKANAVKGFKKFVEMSKVKQKKKNYINEFYARGLKRTTVLGFKMFSRIIDKDSLREKLTLKLSNYEADESKGIFYYFLIFH